MLALVDARRATLGPGRLVCIDGPAGSGKTTFAAAIHRLRPCRVVHMDDLYAGWDGLGAVHAQLATLVAPLARGETGRHRRWDWQAGDWAEEVAVAPSPLLVLEGVGSAAPVAARQATAIVWVEAAHDVRRARALARDGDDFAPYWDAWAAAEAEHFERHRTREIADLVLDLS
ncbi:hypothetical protein GCM10009623_00300 [Nocardioides aestuarii]